MARKYVLCKVLKTEGLGLRKKRRVLKKKIRHAAKLHGGFQFQR